MQSLAKPIELQRVAALGRIAGVSPLRRTSKTIPTTISHTAPVKIYHPRQAEVGTN